MHALGIAIIALLIIVPIESYVNARMEKKLKEAEPKNK